MHWLFLLRRLITFNTSIWFRSHKIISFHFNSNNYEHCIIFHLKNISYFIYSMFGFMSCWVFSMLLTRILRWRKFPSFLLSEVNISKNLSSNHKSIQKFLLRHSWYGKSRIYNMLIVIAHLSPYSVYLVSTQYTKNDNFE